MIHRLLAPALCAVAAAPSLAASEVPSESPVFSSPLEITNVWFPFQVDAVKVFRGSSDDGRLVAVHTFLAATRSFAWNGTTVEARVVRERGFLGGQLVEESFQYVAQADDGAVYFFGEISSDFAAGQVISHEGSWLVGGASLAGDPPETAFAAHPSLSMPATLAEGDQWKSEDLFPIADCTVTVLKVGRKAKVEAGKYTGVVKVLETSQLADSGPEKKWIAPGVGIIRSDGEGEVLALISTTLRSE